MQSNHLDQPGISFKASVARIPRVTGTFTGFIAGFMFNNRLHGFTEYNRSCMSMLSTSEEDVEIEFRTRHITLRLAAPVDKATSLAAPVRGLIDGRIEESMTSVINLTLSETSTGLVVFSGEDRNGSIEISGESKTLMPR